MRSLLAISLLVFATACGNGTGPDGTGPDGTVIHVRLVEDGGKAAGINTVRLTLPSGERLVTKTDKNGKADIRLDTGGEYGLRVVPRAGYVSSNELSRKVSVEERATVVVDFMLHREGYPPVPPERLGN